MIREKRKWAFRSLKSAVQTFYEGTRPGGVGVFLPLILMIYDG